MLKVIDKPVYRTTVTVATLHLKGTVEVEFVALPASQLKLLEAKGSDEVLRAVTAWHEPVEIGGQPVKHARDGGTPDSLDKLLDVPGLGAAMTRRYYASLWEEAKGN